MTVRELIAKLSAMPPDADVLVPGTFGYGRVVELTFENELVNNAGTEFVDGVLLDNAESLGIEEAGDGGCDPANPMGAEFNICPICGNLAHDIGGEG